ncbi:MAG: NlpC/P60 family protein, partial [Bacteroidota bacterium]
GPYFTHRSLVPVRAAARDTAEMVTQLLFGDCVDLLARDRQWMQIRNRADGYLGWIDEKMVLLWTEEAWERVRNWEYVFDPVLRTQWETPHGAVPLHLSLGSRVPRIEVGDEIVFSLAGHTLRLARSAVCHYAGATAADMVAFSARYLGAPYLWGGKSLWGIDCSGFTQICFAVGGISIPRDASQQVRIGKEITFAERKAGDLAFFQNEKGRVNHVGIVLENGLIRHASGCVHDARLTADGIIDINKQRLTHTLCSIKRIS